MKQPAASNRQPKIGPGNPFGLARAGPQAGGDALPAGMPVKSNGPHWDGWLTPRF